MNRTRVLVEGHELRIANLEKVLFPRTGFTKAEMLDYYRRVAPVMLPYLRRRPVIFRRFPDGVEGKSFYERRCPLRHPDWVPTVRMSEADRATEELCVLNDEAALIWAANLATIELHTFLSRAETPGQPAEVAFNLNPNPPATILDCARVALGLRDLLNGMGLQCGVKSSGRRGLHLFLPLNTPVTFAETSHFARGIAEAYEQSHGDLAITPAHPDQGWGRVLVDWEINAADLSLICTYSLRALERPTVAAPLNWNELTTALEHADARSLVLEAEQVISRVEAQGDPFASLLTLEQRLPS